MYMKAMLRISLYSYLYLKVAKALFLTYYLLCFLLNKIGEQEGGTGSTASRRRREVTQTMYTHVSKCKNDKRKEKRNFDLL
jgi:hypothetical protein